MSYIEFDINKDTTDILSLYRYLASKVNRNFEVTSDETYESTPFESSPPEAYDNFFAYFGQDLVQVDPQQLEISLTIGGEIPILALDEKVSLLLLCRHFEMLLRAKTFLQVIMAFQCGRDFNVFTSKGILSIDVQDISGKKIEFLYIPYGIIRYFAVESCGAFDMDSELEITMSTPWLFRLKMEFL